MWTVSRAASGKVRKARRAASAAGALLALLTTLSCSHGTPAPVVKRPLPKKEPTKAVVRNEGGELTTYSSGADRRVLWSIKWKSAEMNVAGEAVTVGKMEKVEGQIYSKGKGTSSFSADTGVADKTNNVLTLSGNVKVASADIKATLKCDRVKWLPEKDVLEGEGNVSVISNTYSLTGVPKVLAKSDFSEVATPDRFEDKDVKKK